MNINILSLIDKTVQVTPKMMRMLGGLLERDVTRDDPEWAAAMASLTVSETKRIKPSIRQHQENERHCRTAVVQQLVSSIPQIVSVRTSYKQKGQEIGTQKKTVTFEEPNKEWMDVDPENPEQETLSGGSDVDGIGHVNERDQTEKILSGEFRWMSRIGTLETTMETCSTVVSSFDNTSRKSESYNYSDRNSGTGSDLSKLAIHSLLVENRARELDREVYNDPDSDRYLIPSGKILDNAADDLESIAVLKHLMNLIPQKEAVRTDLEPFKQETKQLPKVWYVKMEDDTHQPNELNSHLRVMKSYLKVRYRLSDLLRAQRNDRMTINLKNVDRERITRQKRSGGG